MVQRNQWGPIYSGINSETNPYDCWLLAKNSLDPVCHRGFLILCQTQDPLHNFLCGRVKGTTGRKTTKAEKQSGELRINPPGRKRAAPTKPHWCRPFFDLFHGATWRSRSQQSSRAQPLPAAIAHGPATGELAGELAEGPAHQSGEGQRHLGPDPTFEKTTGDFRVNLLPFLGYLYSMSFRVCLILGRP